MASIEPDWQKMIDHHAQMLASGEAGPYDRWLISGQDERWVEVTQEVQDAARLLGWVGV